MNDTHVLTQTINLIEKDAGDRQVAFGTVLTSLNSQGFGPLLMAPALLVVLPTGGIPGLPALCGLTLCFITAQMIAGRHEPWIPRKLARFSFTKGQLLSITRRLRPAAAWVDRHVSTRFAFLSHNGAQRFAALISFVLSFLMVFIGFVPMLPAALCAPILLFALGFTTKDGVFTLAGFGLSIAAFLLVLWLSGFMGGENLLQIEQPVFLKATPRTSIMDFPHGL